MSFGGVVSGASGSRRSALAPRVLTANNPDSGATTVSAGTLVVSGSIANSAVTVNSGAMLAGTGTVGATTINTGGILPAATGTPAP